MERAERIFEHWQREDREKNRRETRRYEYHDEEGRSIRASLVSREIPASPARDEYFSALVAEGHEEAYAKKRSHEIFPGEKIKKLESFILVNDAGDELDVLSDCQLEFENVILTQDGSAGVYAGYDGFLIHEPREIQDLIIFLHELGHFEQNRDSTFLTQQEQLSKEFPLSPSGELMSSPYVAGLEVDANHRARKRAEAWKVRGFDITSSYFIDFRNPVIQALLKQEGAEEIRSQVFISGSMNIDQIIELQLLQHRLGHAAHENMAGNEV